MSLFALSGYFNVPIGVVMRGSLPYLGALLLSLILLWLWTGLSTVFN